MRLPTVPLRRSSEWMRQRSGLGAGLGQTGSPLWHYIDVERAFDKILNQTEVTVLAPYTDAVSTVNKKMAEGIVNVVTNNGGQAQVRTETVGALELTYTYADVSSAAPKSEIDSLLAQMREQAKGSLGSDVKGQAASIILDNIKSLSQKPPVDQKTRNRFSPQPMLFYLNHMPIAHWQKAVDEGENTDSNGGSNGGSNGTNGTTASSTYPVSKAATANDVITIRASGSIPPGLGPGATVSITALGGDGNDDRIDDRNDGDDDTTDPDRDFHIAGLAQQQRVDNYKFRVATVSGPFSNGTVDIRIQGQVPPALSRRVRSTNGKAFLVVSSPAANGNGNGNGSNGGNGNGGGSGGNGNGNGGNGGNGNGGGSGGNGNGNGGNGGAGNGGGSGQGNQILAGTPNALTLGAGGVFLAGVLSAIVGRD